MLPQLLLPLLLVFMQLRLVPLLLLLLLFNAAASSSSSSVRKTKAFYSFDIELHDDPRDVQLHWRQWEQQLISRARPWVAQQQQQYQQDRQQKQQRQHGQKR
ncbi:hypothetical protein Emag_002518 [Eimeria magna]